MTALFLTGCSFSVARPPNPLTLNKSHAVHSKNSAAHHKHVNADNSASADYFLNTPVSNSNENTLWAAMKSNFQLAHYADKPQVQAQINWFMHHQGYLDRTARRAAPFMYYIFQETKIRHLPAELVLLPIIESAYNPFVSSYAGAVGLWQLEPGTARSFGLRQDFWYDGRKDISTSTSAALDYLSYLQNFFGGDWLLSIAAYNTGPGNVESAINRSVRDDGKIDFWSLHLAAATEAYIPRLLALALIISNPSAYGISLPDISNAPYLGQVEVSAQMTLAQAASLAGVSLQELKTLNAGYKKNTLKPHQPYKLLLPIDRIPAFKRNLLNSNENNIPAVENLNNSLWNRYTVQAGDTLSKIAAQFHTPIKTLQSVNHLESEQPSAGTVLLIPETRLNQSAFAAAITAENPNQPGISDKISDNIADNNNSVSKQAYAALPEIQPQQPKPEQEQNPDYNHHYYKNKIHSHHTLSKSKQKHHQQAVIKKTNKTSKISKHHIHQKH